MTITDTDRIYSNASLTLNGHTFVIEGTMVTPELAASMLAHNTHNRNIRPKVVAMYATDMRNGDWQINGQTITFADDGALLDGQHRLSAVIEADTAVPMLIIRGVRNAAQEVQDIGPKRTFSDALRLRGEINTHTLAAIVKLVHLWQEGERRRLFAAAPSRPQLFRTLESNPSVREFTTRGNRVGNHTALPGSVAGFAWWVFEQIDAEDASFFFERLIDGQNLIAGDPIYVLRKTLDSDKATSRSRPDQLFTLAIVIKAWNAYRNGDSVTLFKWRRGGAKPEPFPEPV